MIGSDFNRLPGGGPILTAAIILYTAIVIGLWEIGKTLMSHIHLFWR